MKEKGTGSEPISDETLAALEAGLEGVTPGPWRARLRNIASAEIYAVGLDRVGLGCVAKVVDLSANGLSARELADAEHIARCDPQTIGGLLERIRTLREQVEMARTALGARRT